MSAPGQATRPTVAPSVAPSAARTVPAAAAAPPPRAATPAGLPPRAAIDPLPAAEGGLAALLFSEIFVVDQLARSRLARALPRGMELSHFSVLNHLMRLGGERSPAQIARAFHVTRGAMTNTLTRLERAGHVHIRSDWEDARRKKVALSPAGRAACETALAAMAPLLAETVADLGEERLRQALPVLRALRARLLGEPPEP